MFLLEKFHFSISRDQEQVKWVHLSCAFWVPKIEFDEKMTPVLKDNLVIPPFSSAILLHLNRHTMDDV
jgi:hypothetical protein